MRGEAEGRIADSPGFAGTRLLGSGMVHVRQKQTCGCQGWFEGSMEARVGY